MKQNELKDSKLRKLLKHTDEDVAGEDAWLLAGQVGGGEVLETKVVIVEGACEEFPDKLYYKYGDLVITNPSLSKLLGDLGLVCDVSDSTFVWEYCGSDGWFLYLFEIKQDYYLQSKSYYPAYTPEQLKITFTKRLKVR